MVPGTTLGSEEEQTAQNMSQCQRWYKCHICYKVLDLTKRDKTSHRCGEYYCTFCQDMVMEDHLCYQRAEALPTSTLPKRYIFFDTECRQDNVIECKDGYSPTLSCRYCQPSKRCTKCLTCRNCKQSFCGHKRHTPNLIVSQKACDHCMNDPIEEGSTCHFCGDRCKKCNKYDRKLKTYSNQPCPTTCGRREAVFKGDNADTEFGAWLFQEGNSDSTVMAHNLKG